MAILPDFGAASFIPGAPIDNPYLPLIPGHVLSYSGDETDPDTGEVTTERNDVFTTSATFDVRGVSTSVIRDTVYEDDVILEDTFDWYAQDTAGNVWYFGETVVNYEYDDDGSFIGVNHDGQWSADDPGNQPGWAMKATPEFGTAYYQEFAPGIAEDESILAEIGLSMKTLLGKFEDVIKTIDSSALSTGAEFKYYAPGVGEIAELELAPDGSITSKADLYRQGVVGVPDDDTDDVTPALASLHEGKEVKDLPDVRDLDLANFTGTGTTKQVTVLGGSTDSADALGAYFVDAATGATSEASILVADLSSASNGDSVAVDVPEGQTLCLFLVRGVDETGVDVEQYADGGLHLQNLLTGAPASIRDLFAPTVMDDAGNILPIQPLSALGADDGTNLLNPAGSMQAIGLSSKVPGTAGIDIIGFEDRLNTSPDYDGDFNDAIVAVSDAPIASETLGQLIREAGGAKPGAAGGAQSVSASTNDLPAGDQATDQAGDQVGDWLTGDTFQFADTAPYEKRTADSDFGWGHLVVAGDWAFSCGERVHDDWLGDWVVAGDVDAAAPGAASLSADGFFFA
ncbi:hypothetical protein [Sinorhizobium mexicanum]|uniref:hypothetical protein n=1 Tax=Sinorhizobium mexicanum TaxID=375549 RepID=UPI001D349455|nr:hypothetical protein [Sinorhizobium mexicanum]MBP1885758.1 hypothetical protein [Sinorhizobium mexicanum]